MAGLSFGTSGLRGLVVDFTDDACAAYCAAFIAHLSALGSRPDAVMIGRDLRPSSPAIAARCIAALGRCGVASIDCGALPTPALALEAAARGLPAIMVTGSHIPADRNGLKFYRADGEIGKQDEAGIRMALGGAAPTGDAPPPVVDPDAAGRYVARYAALKDAAPLAGQTVAVFEHSSVSRDMLPEILRSLGARTLTFGRSDVFVPVDTEALDPENAVLIAEFAKAHRVSAIVSTDGDGDRPLVADETGAVVRGDALGLLTAQFLNADVVATPVTSTSAVEESGFFARVARTRVGSPYVIEAMDEAMRAGAERIVGFEANGGVLLGSDVALGGSALSRLPTRDAVLPIIAVLVLAGRSAQGTISGLLNGLPPKRTASGRIERVPSEASAVWLESLQRPGEADRLFAPAPPPLAVDAIDGVRFALDGGRSIHFRASGNAPELRCYAEAATQGAADALLAWGIARARASVLKGDQDIDGGATL